MTRIFKKLLVSAFALSGFALMAAGAADANHKRASYRDDGTRVKGYVLRQNRGGYSYVYADSINTYGNSRTKYGGASVYRDRNLDKQTVAGPFDSGFFFDAANSNDHGGDAPYMH